MDIEVLMRQVSKDLPLYLYGHAMGALLLITLIMRNPQLKIAGVMTTSPLLGFPMDRKIKGIKYWLVRIFGSFLEVLGF
jgi:alpha-beta hydrolase superfamily lysophospholipase